LYCAHDGPTDKPSETHISRAVPCRGMPCHGVPYLNITRRGARVLRTALVGERRRGGASLLLGAAGLALLGHPGRSLRFGLAHELSNQRQHLGDLVLSEAQWLHGTMNGVQLLGEIGMYRALVERRAALPPCHSAHDQEESGERSRSLARSSAVKSKHRTTVAMRAVELSLGLRQTHAHKEPERAEREEPGCSEQCESERAKRGMKGSSSRKASSTLRELQGRLRGYYRNGWLPPLSRWLSLSTAMTETLGALWLAMVQAVAVAVCQEGYLVHT